MRASGRIARPRAQRLAGCAASMAETAETLAPKKELEDLQDDVREVQELLRHHRPGEKVADKGVVDEAPPAEAPPVEAAPGAAAPKRKRRARKKKKNGLDLHAKLERMHPADIAYVLEALPLEERLAVWDLVKADRDGEILLEVSDAVRETLIKSMDSVELRAAAEQLEADQIADLAPDLPEAVFQDVFQSLPVEEREQLRAAMSYPEDAVGALMDFDVVSVREDITLEVATRYLRRLDELPSHTDQLFVVDREQNLKGALPLARLIVTDLDKQVGEVAVTEAITLYPDDKAQQA